MRVRRLSLVPAIRRRASRAGVEVLMRIGRDTIMHGLRAAAFQSTNQHALVAA